MAHFLDNSQRVIKAALSRPYNQWSGGVESDRPSWSEHPDRPDNFWRWRSWKIRRSVSRFWIHISSPSNEWNSPTLTGLLFRTFIVWPPWEVENDEPNDQRDHNYLRSARNSTFPEFSFFFFLITSWRPPQIFLLNKVPPSRRSISICPIYRTGRLI